MDFDDDFELDWHTLALAGSLAEEMTEEAKERIRAELELYGLDQDDEDELP